MSMGVIVSGGVIIPLTQSPQSTPIPIPTLLVKSTTHPSCLGTIEITLYGHFFQNPIPLPCQNVHSLFISPSPLYGNQFFPPMQGLVQRDSTVVFGTLTFSELD